MKEKDYILATFVRIWWWFPLCLIILFGLMRDCIGNDVPPMDNSINVSREIVAHVEVIDSANNGFRVVYATKQKVSDERLEEIWQRPHIQDAFQKLKEEAPKHFGNLLYTDIYDFASFAKRYDVDPDIHIHNIFVSGMKKANLYIGPNPKISNSAKWFDPNTEQGTQYLSHFDIYNKTKKSMRVYRYWKCSTLFSTSSKDERFSHFSEEERIW